MEITLRIVGAVAIVVAFIWAARFIDKRWRAKHPEEKPFVWGYFQALLFFPAGLLWFLTPFVRDTSSWQLWLMILVYGAIGSYAGYVLIKAKKRWAWVFVVLAQLNLVTLLIDIHYGGNRWNEFR